MSVRWFLLHAVCMFYAISFASFYFDYPSLVGPNGILPISETIDTTGRNNETIRSLVAKHWNIIWLHRLVGLPIEQFAELIALVGFALAVLAFVSKSYCNFVTMSILWLAYKSLCDCGSVFYEHIYDRLLLETGVLCIFWTPWFRLSTATSSSAAAHPTDRLVHWFFRWLLVRLTVSITISRLLFDSQSLINNYWWDLVRSSQFYLLAVPNPSQLTYTFASINRNMPGYANLFYGSLGLCTELMAFVGPLTYFVPIRGFRIASFLVQSLLQIYAILAFNFGPFHLLVLVLHCALFKDQINGGGSGANLKRQRYRKLKLAFGMFLWFTVYSVASIFLYELYVTRDNFTIVRKLNQAELATYLSKFLLVVIVVATVSFFVTLIRTNYDAFTTGSSSKLKRSVVRSKPLIILSTFIYSIIAVYVFYLTQLTIQKLHNVEPIGLSETNFLRTLASHRLINEYRDPIRLTDKMMEFGRPEIVLEVTWNRENGPWIELEMDAKVGKLNRIARFNVPYLPRLQYQLWKLAQESFTNGTFSLSLNDFKQNRWFVSYVYRILDPKTSDVFVAYREKNSPRHPLFVRASFYAYQFNTKTAGHFWKRTKKSSNYFEAMHLNGTKHNNELLGLMSATKLKYPFSKVATSKTRDSKTKKQTETNIFAHFPILCEEMLLKIRELSGYLHPEVFIRTSFFALIALKIFFV